MSGRRAVSLLAVLACLAGGRAAAQTNPVVGFALDRFEPGSAGSAWFALDSLELPLTLRPTVGLVLDGALRPLVIYRDNEYLTSLVRHQDVLHFGASFAVKRRLRLGFDLPLALYLSGDAGELDGATVPRPASAVAGDVRLDSDFRLVGRAGEGLRLAVGTAVFIPSGRQAAYLGDGEVRVTPRVQLAGDLGAFVYAVRLGYAYRSLSGSLGGKAIGSELVFGAALGVRLARRLLLGPEVYGSTVVSPAAGLARTTPLEAIMGVHYLLPAGFHVGIGGGAGLTRGLGAPEARLLASLDWVPEREPWPESDRDHDGIEDSADACPDVPGRRTAVPRTNGCPELDPGELPPDIEVDRCSEDPTKRLGAALPADCPGHDRDHDGVPDAKDACPEQAGRPTDDPKTNGCPDRDRDGIPDALDACPEHAGPQTTDPTTTGCPDRDHDGIPDAKDACPDHAGPQTADAKTNGCPDRDQDGIRDPLDACPDQPGPADPDPQKNGCPKARIVGQTIQILDQVRFATASAKIVRGPESEEVLDAVLKIMKELPLLKVRVEGHTDNRGGKTFNQGLSARRAAAVRMWLVMHGIDVARLESAGFGQSRPLQPNETDDGRRKNRRVEFHIIAGLPPASP
jgi:OmpA-OmpF porin, OOP family